MNDKPILLKVKDWLEPQMGATPLQPFFRGQTLKPLTHSTRSTHYA